jgi:hypothetical protein
MLCTSTAARLARSVPGAAALLDELGRHGPAWRAPASVIVHRPEDFVARAAGFGVEGVVAKRLDSTYLRGATQRQMDQAQTPP